MSLGWARLPRTVSRAFLVGLLMLRVLCVCFAALVACPGAQAGIRFGIAGDDGKYGDDAGASFYETVADVGFAENRITVTWDPAEPDTIQEAAFLDRSLPIAEKNGIEVVFDVYPAKARAFATGADARVKEFAAFLKALAQRYPQVRTFIVGNEPNQPRFWQPQFVGRRPVAAATFEHLLAASYDALKSVDPSIVVAGIGLSPRGNDSPSAPSNISRSPVRFLHDLAAEYRRTGRTRPLMDALAFHPYPNANDDPFTRGYGWPNAGVRDLDRIKQAIWDGFHGTAQPVFGEGSRRLRLVLDEYARQVAIPPSLDADYFGTENVPTITEAQQASIYARVLPFVACDPDVSDFFLFHLIDERDLDRFQSGLLRADLSRRPSYDAVQSTLRRVAGGCSGTVRRWRHTDAVVGARVRFARGVARIAAGEQAIVRSGVLPAGLSRAAVATALAAPDVRSHVIRPGGTLVLGPAATMAPGRYVPAVLLRAAMNPERRTLAVGPAFSVG
jgi:hypothetical protein